MSKSTDAAGNLNYRTNNALAQTFNNNSLNELSTVTRSGTLTVEGNTTTTATNVTVNGLTAIRYADLTYARTNFPLVDATTNFTAIAQSAIGLSSTNTVTVDLRATNTLVYDLNGNLRTNGTQILDYDDENRLVTNYVATAWKSEFVYDGANRRKIQRDYNWSGGGWVKTNEARLVYDGNVILQHRDGNNAPTLTLTRGLDLSGSFQGAGGIGGLLAITEASGVSSYYHGDGNGNVTALINANQLIVGRYAYDPFGNTVSTSGPKALINPYRFSSKPIHDASGRYDFLRRWYDPSLQRWPNRDPIGESGGLNLYGFVGNNPISFYDPLGLAWYDDVSTYWGQQASISKNYLDNNAPWVVAGIGDTVLDIGQSFASIPSALGHFGEGSGGFYEDPTLENSIGLVNDFNLAMSFALPIAAKCPTAPKAPVNPTPSAPVTPKPRFIADNAGNIVDTQATPSGRYIQPDRSATDILQQASHPGLDPFTARTHTHPAIVTRNPADPTKGSTRLADPRPVTTEEVINIVNGSAKPSRPKGR